MNDEAKNTPTHSVTRRLAALASLGFGARGHNAAIPGKTLGVSADRTALDLSDPEQRTLGDYELLEEIGQGGMGIVYRARQNSLGREVAVKILAAGPWASSSFTERFRQEAQSAARMQHPNIVAIHEIGEADGISFFSMQYVRGSNLHRRLRAGLGPTDPIDIALLIKTIADAVHYAHELNVLHLDLKPANVLIAEDGRPFIADFGLARPLDHAMATATDEVSGTPSYMAPEQAELRSHALSRATDIYGLGAILYELLTKRPPHLGATPEETMRLVIGGELLAPRKIDKQIPIDLEAICLKCLARNPAERYDSARALSEDAARFIDGNAISVGRQTALDRLAKWYRRKQYSKWTWAKAAALFVAALIVLGYWQITLHRSRISREEIGEMVAAATGNPTFSGDPDQAGRLIDFLGSPQMMDPHEKVELFESMANRFEKLGAERLAARAVLQSEYWRFQDSIDEWVGAMQELGTVDGNIAAAYVNAFGREGFSAFEIFAGNIRFSSESNERSLKIPYAVPYYLKLMATTTAMEKAIDIAGDDADALRMIAPLCNLPWQSVCEAETMYQRLESLDPQNVANWMAVAPGVISGRYEEDALGLPVESMIDQVGRSKPHWKGVEWRLFSAIASSLNNVAPRFVHDQRVSAREVASFTALTQFFQWTRHDEFELRTRCSERAGDLSFHQLSREHCALLLPILDRDSAERSVFKEGVPPGYGEKLQLYWRVGRFEDSEQIVSDMEQFGYSGAVEKLWARHQKSDQSNLSQ